MKQVGIGLGIIFSGLLIFLVFFNDNNTSFSSGDSASNTAFKFDKELEDSKKETVITKIINNFNCNICQRPCKPEKPLDPEQTMWKLWYTGKDNGQIGSNFSNMQYTK